MKGALHLLIILLFVLLAACQDDSNSGRVSRKKRTKKESQTSTDTQVVKAVVDNPKIEETQKDKPDTTVVDNFKTEEIIDESVDLPPVDNSKIEELTKKYSELNIQIIKLKLEYVGRKERLKNLTYQQAKEAKSELAVTKNNIVSLNKKLKELEKDFTPEQLIAAKFIPEAEKEWIDPEITQLSVEDIKTSDGLEYKNIKLMEVCEIGIDIQHTKGIAFLCYEVLPENLQKECNYNPIAAFEFRKERAEKRKKESSKLQTAKVAEEKRRRIISKRIKDSVALENEKKKRVSRSSSSKYKSTVPSLEFKLRKRSINSSSSSSSSCKKASG